MSEQSKEQQTERSWTVGRVLLFPFRLMLALVYILATIIGRSILFTSWAYLLLYFVVSSTAARESVQEMLVDALPGSIEVGAIQWGPWPGTVRVAEVRILSEENDEVLAVPSLQVDVALGRSLTGLAQGLLAPGQPTEITIDSLRIVEPRANLYLASDGRLNLVAALGDGKGEESEGLPKGLEFNVDEIILKDGSAKTNFGPYRGDTKGLNIVGKGGLTADGVIHYQVVRGSITRSLAQLPSFREGQPKKLQDLVVNELQFNRVTGTHRGIEIRDFKASPEHGSLSLDGELEFGPSGLGWQATSTIKLDAESPLIPWLTQEQSDGAVELEVTSKGKGNDVNLEVGLRSPELWALGFPMQDLDLRAKAKLGSEFLVSLQRLSTRALGGHVLLEEGQLERIPNADRFTYKAPLKLTDVDPFAILGSIWVNLAPGALPILEGWLEGRVRLSGAFSPKETSFSLAGTTESLSMRWDGHPKIPLAPEYSLGGQFQITKEGPETEPDPSRALKLTLTDMQVKSGSDNVRLNGDYWPGAGKIKTALTVGIGDLNSFLKAFGVTALAGSAKLKNVTVEGDILAPKIDARLAWSRAKIDAKSIGSVSASVSLDRGLLNVSDVVTSREFGQLRELKASMELFEGSFLALSPSFPFKVSKLHLENVALERLWPSLGITSDINFQLSREVQGTVKNALASIQGAGRLQVNSFATAKHRIRKLSAEVRASRQALHLDNARLTLCRQSSGRGCLGGGPSLAGAITYKKAQGTLDSTVQLADFPLESIKQFLPNFTFEGDVGATLRMEGRLEAPRLMGTAKVRGLKTGGLYLGDASLELSWGEKPGDIIVHSSEFLDGLTLEESELKFRNGNLVSAALRAKSRRVALKRLFPGIQTKAFSLSHTGNVEFSYKPNRVDPWRVHAYAKPGDVAINLHQKKVRFRNTQAATVRVAAGRVEIEPVAWKSKSGTEIDLCGKMDFEGLLDIEVSGRLDMELIRPVTAIRDAFSRVEGGFSIAESPSNGQNKCLPLSQKKILRIGGHRAMPVFAGRLESEKLRLIPRGMGRTLTVKNGSIFELKPGDATGQQKVVLPEGRGLKGAIDEGSFQVAGSIDLVNFSLDTIALDLVGTDIFWASPGEYNVTFNPDLRLSATDFSDERMRRMSIGGEVEITDGTYYKSFDQLAKVLGAVTGSQLEEFSQPITERVPWLKALVMDLGVRTTSHNLNVSSSFALGAADLDARLDLRVQGTLDKPLVFNRIDLAQGGTVTYDILSREFEVQHGYLDFNGEAAKPRIDIRAQAEIEYLESTGTEGEEVEEKSVTLTVNITGSLPDELEIELTGSPGGFDEGDLQSLLLTGKPVSNSTLARDDYQFNVPVGTYLKELLASPFVESVNVGLDSQGDWASEILTRLGRYASLQARAEGESGASTRLSARFQLHLSDSVVLEGNVDRQTGTTTTSNEETYEARIKYRYVVD